MKIIKDLKKQGYSLYAIAKAIGSHYSTVWCWATGRWIPNAESLGKLQKLLEGGKS